MGEVTTAPGPTPGSVRAATVLATLFAAVTVLVAAAPRWLDVSIDAGLSNEVRSGLAGAGGLLDAARVLTWFGHPLVVDVIVLAAVVGLWRRHRPITAIALVGVGAASLIVRALVKEFMARPRPADGFSVATGGSFPSGHTAGAAFVAVAAIVLLRRAWVAVVATAYALVVAASRIVLNVHWLTDVVGGLLLGATFALLLPWACTQIGERWPRMSGSTLPDR